MGCEHFCSFGVFISAAYGPPRFGVFVSVTFSLPTSVVFLSCSFFAPKRSGLPHSGRRGWGGSRPSPSR